LSLSVPGKYSIAKEHRCKRSLASRRALQKWGSFCPKQITAALSQSDCTVQSTEFAERAEERRPAPTCGHAAGYDQTDERKDRQHRIKRAARDRVPK
jgi:hypothetical protein